MKFTHVIIILLAASLLLIGATFLFPERKDTSVLPVSRPLKLVPVEGRIYHAMSPDIFSGWNDRNNMENLREAEEVSTKPFAWVSVSNTWFPRFAFDTECRLSQLRISDSGIKFPRRDVELAIENGYIPSIRMLPYDRCITKDYDRYSMQTFIDGDHDEELRAWAREAREIQSPLLLTFGVEVNGYWFPWNSRYNGGNAKSEYGDPDLYDGHERFRDAYRRIIDIFREENVENVTWFYHVNCVWPEELGDPESSVDGYYPGDDYIDWIAISCYGSQDERNPFWWDMSFTFDHSYKLIEDSDVIGKDKPVALMEFGVVEEPRKPLWIERFLGDVIDGEFPRLKAIAWWQSNFCIEWEGPGGVCSEYSDLRINSSEEALNTYNRMIDNPLFVSEPVFE